MSAAADGFMAAVRYFAHAQCLLAEQWPPQARVHDGDRFDVIVAGAGATGSVLAARLSEIRDWSVLLVEAGPNPPLESIIPYYWFPQMQTGQYAWNYTTTPDGETSRGFKGGSYPLLRGRLLGGCSSTNGMIYVRGDRSDYDAWLAAGNDGWDWRTVLRYMKKAETLNDRTLDARTRAYHGSGGPVSVARYNYTEPELTDDLIRSFGELGLEVLSDVNGATRLGVARIYGHLYEGRRMGMAKAYLNPARHRTNLHVLTNTLVTKVLIDEATSRATGVEVRTEDGTVATFSANLEVIVSAGAVNSPQILMLSGIGPREHLESLEIKVIRDLAVGRNYQDHYFVPLPIVADGGNITSQKQKHFEAIKYLYNQTGALASIAYPDLIALHNVTPGINYPELEYLMFSFENNDTNTAKDFYTRVNFVDSVVDSLTAMSVDQRVFLYTPILLHPNSRGYVELDSTDPTAKPIIYPNLFDDLSDLDVMVDGLRKLSEIVNTTFFRANNAQLGRIRLAECDGLEFMSDEYWGCTTYHLSCSYLHPVGTCKMGPRRDPTAVVGSDLVVHGLENLRVVDASVMPTHLSGNPQATCVMIGEKTADVIKRTYGRLQ